VALSDEQQAMLRLLSQGEQGYGDIAALLGLSEAEVRAKVVGALAQLEAEGKPAPNVPPPVPGGARPAAEAAPPEPEEYDEDEEPAVAEAVAPKAAPKPKAKAGAKSKRAPKPKTAAAATPPSADRPPAAGRTITLPTGRGAWLLGGGILAAIAVIVVVIILVSGGGGNDDSSTTAAETPAAETEGAATGGGAKGATEEGTENTAKLTPTQARLTPVDGSEAEGTATFGRVEVENKEGEKEGKLALQIEASGLEATEKEKTSYTIWIAETPRKMLPLVFGVEVEDSGKAAGQIGAQFEVPVEVLAYLAAGTFDEVAITRTDDEELKASVEAATKAKETPKYLGEPVLRGTISGPIIGLAKREEEAKKEKGE
jgi:hypothetical protein